MQHLLRRAAAAAFVAALAGCASSTYRLDTTVQAFSSLASVPPSPTYRIERLPSQAVAPDQARTESLADPALFRAGLRRDDAAPRYTVQVFSRTQGVLSASPLGGGFGWGWPWGWGPPVQTAANTAYQREVNVVIREVAGNRVVYESKASSETFYLNNDEVVGALFDAALAGFPNPPQGTRRITVQVMPVQVPAVASAPAQGAPAAPTTR